VTLFQFIASLVGSLAWPLTVLLLALVFHRPILALLEKVRRFKGWGFEVSLDDQIVKLAEDTARVVTLRTDEAGAEIPAALPAPGAAPIPAAPHVAPPPPKPKARRGRTKPPPTPEKPRPAPVPPRRFTGGPVDNNSSRGLIMSGWAEIEFALARAAYENDIDDVNPITNAVHLREIGKLRPETFHLVREAMTLRNNAAHLPVAAWPDLHQALLYMTSAGSIALRVLEDAGLAGDGAPPP
jgi:hypothetical protein